MKQNKSKVKCPECGGGMVVENASSVNSTTKIRRCDNLIDIGPNQPLQPCLYEEEIHKNGRVIK